MRLGASLGSLALLAGCGIAGGSLEATTFADVHATLIDGVEVECRETPVDDCEQAVSAVVNGVPYGHNVVAVEIGPLEQRLQVTPEPPWAASARAEMVDGFVYELVIIQEVRPGPMEISFAPD